MSAIPWAALPRSAAVAGATIMRSHAPCVAARCGISRVRFSMPTAWPESASKVKGVTKCAAASVMMTLTSAPAFFRSLTSSQDL